MNTREDAKGRLGNKHANKGRIAKGKLLLVRNVTKYVSIVRCSPHTARREAKAGVLRGARGEDPSIVEKSRPL